MEESKHSVHGWETGGLPLLAYRTRDSGMRLVPATSSRGWMDETSSRFAYHCLPLKMANQAGWFVLNDRPLRAVWDGGTAEASVAVEYLDGRSGQEGVADLAAGHFGYGILTFHVPFLFRTPPGYDLLVRGPANRPKDGIAPLEGLVEADWLVGTATMNWRFTRPDQEVRFDAGEPVCMVVPQKRGELERFAPEQMHVNDDLETAYDYWRWSESRWSAMADRAKRNAEGRGVEPAMRFQKHYARGSSPTGVGPAEGVAHRRRLRLRPFREASRQDEDDDDPQA